MNEISYFDIYANIKTKAKNQQNVHLIQYTKPSMEFIQTWQCAGPIKKCNQLQFTVLQYKLAFSQSECFTAIHGPVA